MIYYSQSSSPLVLCNRLNEIQQPQNIASEFNAYIKKVVSSFPEEVVFEVLKRIPFCADEFISNEYEITADVKSSKSFKAIVKVINSAELPLIRVGFTFSKLQRFISFNPDLKYVNLRGYAPNEIDDVFVNELLTHCKHIQTLILPKCRISYSTLLKIKAIQLIKLDLSECSIYGNALNSPLSFPTTLLSLRFKRLSFDYQLEHLPSGLRELDLSCLLSKHPLKLPPNLTSLNLSHAYFDKSDQLKLPAGLTCLDVSFSRLARYLIRNLPHGLTCLKAKGTSVKNADLDKLPINIRQLDLDNCKNLSKQILLKLPQQIVNLKINTLQLSDLEVARLPPSVTKLSFDMRVITDAGMANLPIGITSLTSSSHYQAKRFTIFSPTLKQLKFCESSIDEVSVAYFPENLTHLNMQSSRISNIGIEFLSTYPLVYLNLESCQGITDAGIRDLPGTITNLNLSLCLVTDEGLKSLPPQLRKLYLRYSLLVRGICFKFFPRSIRTLDLEGLQLETFSIIDLPIDLKKVKLKKSNVSLGEVETLPKNIVVYF